MILLLALLAGIPQMSSSANTITLEQKLTPREIDQVLSSWDITLVGPCGPVTGTEILNALAAAEKHVPLSWSDIERERMLNGGMGPAEIAIYRTPPTRGDDLRASAAEADARDATARQLRDVHRRFASFMEHQRMTGGRVAGGAGGDCKTPK